MSDEYIRKEEHNALAVRVDMTEQAIRLLQEDTKRNERQFTEFRVEHVQNMGEIRNAISTTLTEALRAIPAEYAEQREKEAKEAAAKKEALARRANLIMNLVIAIGTVASVLVAYIALHPHIPH